MIRSAVLTAVFLECGAGFSVPKEHFALKDNTLKPISAISWFGTTPKYARKI